jgi:hypothetical protein
LVNCGASASRLNVWGEEDESICFDLEEEGRVGGSLLLFVAFVPVEKVLVKGREDKPRIAPAAPIYFKKSRREIFPSELDSVSGLLLDM